MIELMVSTGIIILILGLIFAGYPKFRARSGLAALTREVGLLVRQAQVYGLAVKEFPARSGEFPAYGVHMDSTNPREIILFADTDTTPGHRGTYQSGAGCGGAGDSECIRRFTITGTEYIDKFCVIPGGGVQGGTPEEVCDINELNITYRRPDPEAIIVAVDSSQTFNGATIYLRSGSGEDEVKVIRVWITGQISVQ